MSVLVERDCWTCRGTGLVSGIGSTPQSHGVRCEECRGNGAYKQAVPLSEAILDYLNDELRGTSRAACEQMARDIMEMVDEDQACDRVTP